MSRSGQQDSHPSCGSVLIPVLLILAALGVIVWAGTLHQAEVERRRRAIEGRRTLELACEYGLVRLETRLRRRLVGPFAERIPSELLGVQFDRIVNEPLLYETRRIPGSVSGPSARALDADRALLRGEIRAVPGHSPMGTVDRSPADGRPRRVRLNGRFLSSLDPPDVLEFTRRHAPDDPAAAAWIGSKLLDLRERPDHFTWDQFHAALRLEVDPILPWSRVEPVLRSLDPRARLRRTLSHRERVNGFDRGQLDAPAAPLRLGYGSRFRLVVRATRAGRVVERVRDWAQVHRLRCGVQREWLTPLDLAPIGVRLTGVRLGPEVIDDAAIEFGEPVEAAFDAGLLLDAGWNAWGGRLSDGRRLSVDTSDSIQRDSTRPLRGWGFLVDGWVAWDDHSLWVFRGAGSPERRDFGAIAAVSVTIEGITVVRSDGEIIRLDREGQTVGAAMVEAAPRAAFVASDRDGIVLDTEDGWRFVGGTGASAVRTITAVDGVAPIVDRWRADGRRGAWGVDRTEGRLYHWELVGREVADGESVEPVERYALSEAAITASGTPFSGLVIPIPGWTAAVVATSTAAEPVRLQVWNVRSGVLSLRGEVEVSGVGPLVDMWAQATPPGVWLGSDGRAVWIGLDRSAEKELDVDGHIVLVPRGRSVSLTPPILHARLDGGLDARLRRSEGRVDAWLASGTATSGSSVLRAADLSDLLADGFYTTPRRGETLRYSVPGGVGVPLSLTSGWWSLLTKPAAGAEHVPEPSRDRDVAVLRQNATVAFEPSAEWITAHHPAAPVDLVSHSVSGGPRPVQFVNRLVRSPEDHAWRFRREAIVADVPWSIVVVAGDPPTVLPPWTIASLDPWFPTTEVEVEDHTVGGGWSRLAVGWSELGLVIDLDGTRSVGEWPSPSAWASDSPFVLVPNGWSIEVGGDLGDKTYHGVVRDLCVDAGELPEFRPADLRPVPLPTEEWHVRWVLPELPMSRLSSIVTRGVLSATDRLHWRVRAFSNHSIHRHRGTGRSLTAIDLPAARRFAIDLRIDPDPATTVWPLIEGIEVEVIESPTSQAEDR